MCLIAMAIGQSARFPWVCIANRDEFNHRPTAPMSFWQDQTTLLAGRDLQSGGTWMGVNAQGRVAMLTNIRNSALNKGDNAPSRGNLINDYLIHSRLPDRSQSADYSGFNLIVGDLKNLQFLECSNHHLSNNKDAGLAQEEFVQRMNPDYYSISNGSLKSSWPKTRRLNESLRTILENQASEADALKLAEQLMPLLQNRQQAPDMELPNTGIPFEWERMLSAIQIVSPTYGTRSSTVMILDNNKGLHVQEVSYHPDGSPMQTLQFNLAV